MEEKKKICERKGKGKKKKKKSVYTEENPITVLIDCVLLRSI